MSDIAIRVEGLGKRYRIGGSQEAYKTLRDTLAAAAWRPVRVLRSLISSNGARAAERQTIWALKDVSFEIRRGEVMGVIGRNGAGKSTLLKILSRITEPTEGHAQIHGRVGSLLEVGTGFHGELTGRENIYLNGAILGMKRAEIERKFDEIVAFAEVEKFIDTPVKHYSSGMYLRLAFGVAAHLDPEILLVDEVLAVGDAAFQDRCLHRMRNIAGQGRTILFVSHNMNAIRTLCGSVVLLEAGRVAAQGSPESIIRQYLGKAIASSGRIVFDHGSPGSGSGIRLRSISLIDGAGNVKTLFPSSEAVNVVLEVEVDRPTRDLCIGFDIQDASGVTVFRTYQNDQAPVDWPQVRPGNNRLRCTLPSGLLNSGTYTISPRIGEHCKQWLLQLDSVISFQVMLTHGVSPYWLALDGSNRPGLLAPILKWEAE